MIGSLAWLHLSDFHFVCDGDEFSQETSSTALLADVRERMPFSPPVSFVLVSGDVAQSGLEGEYQRASQFFAELAAVLEIPQSSVFFAPGNHDVDRGPHKVLHDGFCRNATSQAGVDVLLANEGGELTTLLTRQSNFWTFVEEFCAGQERTSTADGLGYVAAVDIAGFKVCVIALNSAWLCGRDGEQAHLVIGERQMLSALGVAEALGAPLQIGMSHHPVAWLTDWDQQACTRRVLGAVDVFHTGHLHHDTVTLGASPARPCVMVAAGAGHSGRFHGNSYNHVGVDLGRGECVVSRFKYDPDSGMFGAADAISAKVSLRGSLPGTASDMASALSSIGAGPFEAYLAGLLTGWQSELPVLLDDRASMVSSSIAIELIGADAVAQVEGFLQLANLLRLYEAGVPIEIRLSDHREAVSGFCDYLNGVVAADQSCLDLLSARGAAALGSGAARALGGRPQTLGYLIDLHDGGDFEALEPEARRHLRSDDPLLAHLARRFLVESLLRSDEGELRDEAVALVPELVEGSLAESDDYIVAAAAVEVVGDPVAAVGYTSVALDRWPEAPQLREFAQALALQTGSAELRAKLDAPGGER